MRRPSSSRPGSTASPSWTRRARAGGRCSAGSTWCARSSACTACASSRRPGAWSARGAGRSRRWRIARTRTMSDEAVEIYSDGACRGNPGPGGWGAVLRYKGKAKGLWGGEARTTNNRMELMAVIRALEALKRPSKVKLYTDSQYVQKGISTWIHAWKRRAWRTVDKKDVKNADLWRELEAQASRHEVEWHWVKGHAGQPENERADALANKGIPQNDAEAGST